MFCPSVFIPPFLPVPFHQSLFAVYLIMLPLFMSCIPMLIPLLPTFLLYFLPYLLTFSFLSPFIHLIMSSHSLFLPPFLCFPFWLYQCSFLPLCYLNLTPLLLLIHPPIHTQPIFPSSPFSSGRRTVPQCSYPPWMTELFFSSII